MIDCLERRPIFRRYYVPAVTTATLLAVLYDLFVRR